jgi:hypothetical protein
VDLSQKEIKTAMINFFARNCLSPVNVKIVDIKGLTSISQPCGYELCCFCKFDPEDRLIKDNQGREKLLHHLIEEHKAALKMNIKEYCIKFYDEENFRTSIYLHCNCNPPSFITDKMYHLWLSEERG